MRNPHSTLILAAVVLGSLATAPANGQATELLSDGGFEVGVPPAGNSVYTGLSGAWTWQSAGAQGTATPRYHNGTLGAARTGDWCLYFDLGPSTDRLFQTVTIPSGATATLSFWVKIGTSETSLTTAYDTLNVSIADTSGTVLGGRTYSNLDASDGYQWFRHAMDVSAYAGRTVRLQFDTVEDSADKNTAFMVDDVSILASTSPAGGPTTVYVLPSSAHLGGLNSSFYTTDVTIANRGLTDATLTLQFLGHDQDGSAGPRQVVALAANRAVTYVDILASVFNIAATDAQNYGPILIVADSAALKIVGQTSTPSPGGSGTFGQSVPAQGANDFVTPSSPKSLVGLRDDAAFRTNAVLANATASSAVATLSLIAEDGTTFGTTTRTLPPYGMTQVSAVVTALGAPFGTANAVLVVSTTTNGARIATYAAVIDNGTNDPRTILP